MKVFTKHRSALTKKSSSPCLSKCSPAFKSSLKTKTNLAGPKKVVPYNSFTTNQKRFFAKSAGKEEKQIKLELSKPFKLHNLEEGPSINVTTTGSELKDFYKKMSLIRRVEVSADNLYKQRKIKGFLHLCNGQEAIVVGTEASITWKDHIITAYRDHGHYIGRGGTAKEVLAELMGKEAGCAKGKGGSMHMYLPKNNFYGGNGIVGAQVPIGAGIAFAQKYLGTGQVTLASYGDGASNQGQIFEAMNMAALWKLPIIFVCENNKYGMGTSINRSSASTRYYARGDYVPGVKIDAMNVLAVKEGVKWAADYCRAGNGPLVLEMETYRYMGHSMSDPGLSYRTRDEVNQIRAERDPIDYCKHLILQNEVGTEEELKEFDKAIRKEVDEAVTFAQQTPDPPLKNTFDDVLSSKPYYVRTKDFRDSLIVE